MYISVYSVYMYISVYKSISATLTTQFVGNRMPSEGTFQSLLVAKQVSRGCTKVRSHAGTDRFRPGIRSSIEAMSVDTLVHKLCTYLDGVWMKGVLRHQKM